jgi:predicted TIM-barrel fold metal-dependent hydrolase
MAETHFPPTGDDVALDPHRTIIDPHHHLWSYQRPQPSPAAGHAFEAVLDQTPRYLHAEFQDDLSSGHDVQATVYVECGSSYLKVGAPFLRPVGETQFAVGQAAAVELAPGRRIALGIVAYADLSLGSGAEPVLQAHSEAAGERFKGVRHAAAYDADPTVLGPLVRAPEHLFLDKRFQEGVALLGRAGLSFDAWLLEPQLPDLTALADACPDTPIVLDHLGAPLGIGRYAGRRQERFGVWREAMKGLAQRPLVSVKVGGLGMPFAGFPPEHPVSPPSSSYLAQLWRPYIETAVEIFGADRCMFEKQFSC